MPASGSRLKGVPKTLPIGRLALELFYGEQPRTHGRFFSRWTSAASFKPRWGEACHRDGVHDLHFHDLRHTSLSWLLEAGCDYAVIQMLDGHKVPGVTKDYLHLWDKRLRETAQVLEQVLLDKFRSAWLDERSAITSPQKARMGTLRTSWALAKMIQ